jgi:transcriptional regulator with XRE-family HTH domain
VYLMPRKPSFHHPLRQLRTILGKKFTQKKLAQELGVSEAAIKRIENGTLKLSTEMKGRIAEFAGVNAASIDGGNFTWGNNIRFDNLAFRAFRWYSRTRGKGDEVAHLRAWEKDLQRQTIREIGALTNAAADNNKFHVVLYVWSQWLARTICDFNLWDAFQRKNSELPVSISEGRLRELELLIKKLKAARKRPRWKPSHRRKK